MNKCLIKHLLKYRIHKRHPSFKNMKFIKKVVSYLKYECTSKKYNVIEFEKYHHGDPDPKTDLDCDVFIKVVKKALSKNKLDFKPTEYSFVGTKDFLSHALYYFECLLFCEESMNRAADIVLLIHEKIPREYICVEDILHRIYRIIITLFRAFCIYTETNEFNTFILIVKLLRVILPTIIYTGISINDKIVITYDDPISIRCMLENMKKYEKVDTDNLNNLINILQETEYTFSSSLFKELSVHLYDVLSGVVLEYLFQI